MVELRPSRPRWFTILGLLLLPSGVGHADAPLTVHVKPNRPSNATGPLAFNTPEDVTVILGGAASHVTPQALPRVRFTAVDGTVAAATAEESPWVLFKGSDPDVWYYAPRWGRLASRAGRPALSLTAKVKNNPDGTRTWQGGQLAFLFEVAHELPPAEETAEWVARITALHSDLSLTQSPSFRPLTLFDGKMDVHGLDAYVVGTPTLKDVKIGPASTVAIAVALSGAGAELFYKQLMKAGVPPVIAIMADFRYKVVMPSCIARVSGSKKKTYDYFSKSTKARASYMGAVGGSYDRSKTRADLKTSGGLTVEIIGTCENAGIDKLTASLFDRFVTKELTPWMKDPAPVDAKDPSTPLSLVTGLLKGFSGGVSHSMKEMHYSESDVFSADISIAELRDELHVVSFNFEHAIGQLKDAPGHISLIDDDRVLDFKVVVSACEDLNQCVALAAYTRGPGTDPVRIALQEVDGRGATRSGLLQWSPDLGERATSARVSVLLDFKPPLGSVQREIELPVSNVGVLHGIDPNEYVSTTLVTFLFESTSKECAAVCGWEYVPPAGSQSKPASGVVKVFPDQEGKGRPETEIRFGFDPRDRASGGYIKLNVTGTLGDWAGKKVAPEVHIPVGQPDAYITWAGAL